MKNFIAYTSKRMAVAILALVMATACNDDFLERDPLDAVSDASFFNTAADLQSYVNQFYNSTLPRYIYTGGALGAANVGLDLNSDLMVQNNNPRMLEENASSLAPVTSGLWTSGYDNIRSLNYFMENYDRIPARDEQTNQYIGEGYFFRAWQYFQMLQAFGGVPYITAVLDPSDKEELYRTRDSRHQVALGIVQDLDSAIANLNWKGTGSAAPAGRVNKETAIVVKARVALFEGTWERYHAANGTPFAVSGQNGDIFLEMIAPAMDELIDHQGGNIFMNGGPFNEAYNQLFAQYDASASAGVFWFRVYDTEILQPSHNFYGNIGESGVSMTDRFVGMYLDANGEPQSLSGLALDYTDLNNLGTNLEPRFRQTIWTPDRGPQGSIAGLTDYRKSRYPLVEPVGDINFTSTGYRRWKGAIFDEEQFRNGDTDDILVRYAEGLLAYAEAKAILGTISQGDLDKTINVLRGRVGTPDMVLSNVNAWPSSIYSKSEGFDPTETNIVNEIRRERTVELAMEGFRFDDLRRWAVMTDAINGYKPSGAHAQQFLDYFNDTDRLSDDGFDPNEFDDVELTVGVEIDVDANGFINPFFRRNEFQSGGNGYFVQPLRGYLNGIPSQEIDLYNENGVTLSQNPGYN